MKLNLKVRLQNPVFVGQIVMSILVPILGYAGLTVADLTTWRALGDVLLNALSNPYCLGLMVVSVYNALIDPTTPGLKDSQRVLEKSNINNK